jgi:hypothetical protein
MSETNPLPSMVEKPKPTDAIPAAVRDWGVAPLLNAQADLLAGAEATVTDWLRRRHDAVVDMQQLIARMHTGFDPADTFKAQRELMSRSFQRLAADAEACHSATQHLLDRAPSWFPNGGWMWFPWGAGSTDTPATQAAATRAAGRPLRMANKSE